MQYNNDSTTNTHKNELSLLCVNSLTDLCNGMQLNNKLIYFTS
jgi:hypothetical protein